MMHLKPILLPCFAGAALLLSSLSGCTEPDCLETGECIETPVATGGASSASGGASSSVGGITPVPASGDGGSGGADPGGGEGGSDSTEPCSDEGERKCAGMAEATVLECTGGFWTIAETCARGELCDSTEASCAPIAAGCERVAPGAAYCEGNELVVCGPDLVTVERETCEGRCASGACVSADCGDGAVNADEECDDGNSSDFDDCTTHCKLGTCGDGFLYLLEEECDDGNLDDTDDCTSECKIAVCGDEIISLDDEECDDGNLDDTDACTSECKMAVCGDTFVRKGVEECDDANAIETDECLSTCKLVICGDEVVAGAEQCDDGNSDDSDDCPTNCRNAVCGDGFVLAGEEECDDNNEDSGDGCSSDCQAEPKHLALGAFHSCAILGDGRLKCWGNNEYTQLGPGDDAAVGDSAAELGSNLPAVLLDASAVAAGDRHTCAIRTGSVLCWGANDAGQLGPGVSISTSAAPVRVAIEGQAIGLCAAGTVNAALMEDGNIHTWGSTPLNSTGGLVRLEDFPNTAGNAPLSVSCGDRLICARYPEGAHCWGNFYDNVVGAREADLMEPVVALSVGSRHACALNTAGELKCFGYSPSAGAALFQNPGKIFDWPDHNALNPSVTGGKGIAVGAGGESSCVVFEDGTLKCWGQDLAGNLGQPALTLQDPTVGDVPEELGAMLPAIELGFGLKVQSVVTSGNHTCALFTSGRLKCWGLNDSGQLGIGSTESMGDAFGELGPVLPYVSLD